MKNFVVTIQFKSGRKIDDIYMDHTDLGNMISRYRALCSQNKNDFLQLGNVLCRLDDVDYITWSELVQY